MQTLPCSVRTYVFNNFNFQQAAQVCCGTIERFNEVWWFYCSASSTTIDSYVVYNYVDNDWYYGSMARTAWSETGLNTNPIAASYLGNLLVHENGLNDVSTGVAAPIDSFVQTSEFDIADGDHFVFVRRMLPDLQFQNSVATNPTVTLTLYPLKEPGAGFTNPASVAGFNYAAVTRSVSTPIEQFTPMIFPRVRGRQLVFKIESNQLDTAWQLGTPLIDVRQDGRK